MSQFTVVLFHSENVNCLVPNHESVPLVSDIGSVVRHDEVEPAMHHVGRVTEWNAVSWPSLK